MADQPKEITVKQRCNRNFYLRNKDRVLEQSRQWRINNPERYREAQKKWAAENGDKLRKSVQKYKDRNREKIRKANLAYYYKNREKMIARSREQRKTNPEVSRRWRESFKKMHPEYGAKKAEMRRKWYLTNKDVILAKSKEYRKNNRAKVCAWAQKRRAMQFSVTVNAESAAKFYEFVRSKNWINCYYCGVRVSGAKAHVDHVISLNKHGNHCSSNLAASCGECNTRKSVKKPSELTFTDQPLLDL